MNSVPVIWKHRTMAGKSGTHKRSENSSAETQINISMNTPSIPFDKPKKSKDKFDDEGNYKKSKFLLNLGKRTLRESRKRYLYVYLEILIRHLKRG